MTTEINKPINQILAALPKSEYQRIASYLKPVELIAGQILLEPNEPVQSIYFPQRAMISLVSIMIDGSTTEIGIVGNEGMVGLPAIFGGAFYYEPFDRTGFGNGTKDFGRHYSAGVSATRKAVSTIAFIYSSTADSSFSNCCLQSSTQDRTKASSLVAIGS